jgi:hypothetical protein
MKVNLRYEGEEQHNIGIISPHLDINEVKQRHKNLYFYSPLKMNCSYISYSPQFLQ